LRSGWLEDEIGRRHYSQTRVLLERLAGQTDAAGSIHYFYAEMYRRRAKSGDLALAEQEYRTALQAADAPASAWRGLGLTLRQQGRTADARAAFVRYLSAAPAASDRAMIESWIE
jgi:Flp pilus assembly protein TadD